MEERTRPTTSRRPRTSNRAAIIKPWRAADGLTGIGQDRAGIRYTYQPVTATPRSTAEAYRVETYTAPTYADFVKQRTPSRRAVYYIPASHLDKFSDGWGGPGAVVIDVRPITWADAIEELRAFRRATEGRVILREPAAGRPRGLARFLERESMAARGEGSTDQSGISSERFRRAAQK